MSTPPSTSPKLHDLSSAAYTKGIASSGHGGHLGLQLPAAEAPAMQEVPRPMAVQPSSPEQPPPTLLQPQVSPHLSSSGPLGCQQALCPNSPSSPSTAHEPTCLQPSAHPPATGHQHHQVPKVQRNEPPAAGPLSLPEVCEDSNHNLAPIPVTIKREPEELDQLYLDDGKCLQPYRCVPPGTLFMSSQKKEGCAS
jgi:nuclear factor of activated T-cells